MKLKFLQVQGNSGGTEIAVLTGTKAYLRLRQDSSRSLNRWKHCKAMIRYCIFSTLSICVIVFEA